LTEAEKDIYSGAGRHLAMFKDGVLTELLDLSSVAEIADAPHAEANDILTKALAWMEERYSLGEIWLVMCSCYELCEPVPMIRFECEARLGRVIGDMVAEHWYDG